MIILDGFSSFHYFKMPRSGEYKEGNPHYSRAQYKTLKSHYSSSLYRKSISDYIINYFIIIIIVVVLFHWLYRNKLLMHLLINYI